jgi:hypothetical protein
MQLAADEQKLKRQEKCILALIHTVKHFLLPDAFLAQLHYGGQTRLLALEFP